MVITIKCPISEVVLRKGHIYMLVHEDRPEEALYVGSTSARYERFMNHLSQMRHGKGPLHRWAKEQNCVSSIKMVILADVEFYTLRQLQAQEFKFQEKL